MQTPSPAVATKVSEVALAYYRQMELFAPQERDLIDWFIQLSKDEKTNAAAVRPDSWPALTEFKRYYLEQQGHSMSGYMTAHLTAKDLSWWADNAA